LVQIFRGQVAEGDPTKKKGGSVTVELYEATVPIPVTVRGDQIRVLDSEER
jgi:transcriptional antiterminator NusG